MKSALLLTLCCSAFLGCGAALPPWGTVAGTITQKGKPVEPAVVLFANRAAGIEMTGETDAEGHFKIRTDRFDGLPVGEYKVVVTPKAANLPPPTDQMMFTGPAPAAPPSAIPLACRDIESTKLQATVKLGDNDFLFELEP